MLLPTTSSASISSPLVSDRPTSEPSKYIAHVPLVVLPRAVGVNASTSSSLAELTPVTTGLPVVEINRRPSESRDRESIFSFVVSSKPTSLPSKYKLNVPAVLLPNEVASKRRISCGVAVIPLTVTLAVKDIKMESESRNENPKRSGLPTPTSEPSNNTLQFVPSNFRISSSAEDTPPIV